MDKETTVSCPCGSGLSIEECCHVYLSRTAWPSTSEQLMRARYTAFTLVDMDFLKDTSTGPALENYDEDIARNWAEKADWLGLKVIRNTTSETDDEVEFVEFIARFMDGEREKSAHEISEFRKVDGKWYYYDGIPSHSRR